MNEQVNVQPQEQQLTVDVQDIINTLTVQRNTALDEIVKQGAIIKALQRELEEATKPKEIKHGETN